MTDRTSTGAMQEYYIRKEGDEDSRGPFTVDQLASLAEAGQLDRQTFYYDSLTEKWVELQSNPELVATLFPAKKKLSIRPKEIVETINIRTADETKDEPILVQDMLAAAEGKTDDTRGKNNLTAAQARAAHWGLRMMSLILLTSAAGLLVNNMAVLMGGELTAILTQPQILFGVIDLLLAVLLFLEVTSIYGLIRFRAAVGLGFFLFFFWTWSGEQLIPIVAVAAGSLALFVLTLVASLKSVIPLGILGLAGMGAFAYILLS